MTRCFYKYSNAASLHIGCGKDSARQRSQGAAPRFALLGLSCTGLIVVISPTFHLIRERRPDFTMPAGIPQ
jgi:hypothetical protein